MAISVKQKSFQFYCFSLFIWFDLSRMHWFWRAMFAPPFSLIRVSLWALCWWLFYWAFQFWYAKISSSPDTFFFSFIFLFCLEYILSTLFPYPSCLFTHTARIKYSVGGVSLLQFHGVIVVIVFYWCILLYDLFYYVLCPVYRANISNCVICIL